MPSSPEDISPTDSAAREARETSSNGFTAVNGRSSPPPPAKPAKHGGEVQPTSRDGQPQPQPQQNRGVRGEHVQRRLDSADGQSSVSPLNHPGKRKRSGSPDDEEEDEDYSGDNADDSAMDDKAGQGTYVAGDGRGTSTNGRSQDLDSSDAQLAAALVRETGSNGYGDLADDGENGSPSRDFVQTKAGVLVNTAKRKRAFANRTKTGCQTCRRRKKKCDEIKPECHNCVRGGFKCEGYSAQKTFTKSTPPKPTPMPIQSKDGYGDTGGIYPRPVAAMEQAQRPGANPFAATPAHQLQRQFGIDDDLRDPSRPWSTASPYQPASTRYSVDRRSVDGLSGMNGIHPSYDRVAYSTPSMVARQALNTIRPSSRTANKTEKQKMIDGDEYCPFDCELVKDREFCRSNLDRYNTNTSVSREERERQLRSIVEPDTRPPLAIGQDKSRLGKNVLVEAPFTCDYGYNVTLHDNVIIERGCEVQDACEVRIGEGSFIGANVRIVTKTVPYRADDRSGTTMRLKGVKVHIGERVHIGTGCVLVPDYENKEGILEIGNGAYIKPFTMVSDDIRPDVVFGVLQRDGPKVLNNVAIMDEIARPRPILRDPYHFQGPTDPSRV